MQKDWIKNKSLVWIIISFIFLFGCRAIVKPIPEVRPGIDYRITPLVKLTKVTLYEGKDKLWWIDISVKNVAGNKQAFRVTVRVDDWAPISSFTGGVKRSELEPQKEETIKLRTLSKSMPKSLSIEIKPYP